MPFDFGETINAGADAFLRAPIVRTIASHPIYTAMIIVVIMILIIMFVFRDTDTSESLFVMALRTGFWTFLVALGTIFLHDKVLSNDVRVSEMNESINDVFGSNVKDLEGPV